MIRGFVASVGCLVLLVAVGCSAPIGRPTVQDCRTAERLIQSGFPRQADPILGTATPTEPNACATARTAAAAAIAESTAKVLPGKGAVTPEDVVAALRLDRENPAAFAALTALTATPAAATPEARLCATAKALLASGLPRRALALVGSDPNASGCASTVGAALEAITAATALAVAAEELKTGPEADVHAKADQALAKDQENVAARLARAWVKPQELTAAERLKDSWESLAEKWLDPLRTVAVPAVIVFVGLVLTARLAAAVRLPWRPRSQGGIRRLVWLGGFALCTLTAVLTPVLQLRTPFPSSPGGWVLLLVLAAFAVALLACWFATGTRLSVTATDEQGATDAAAGARLVSFLADLGAEQPRGPVVPKATDVSVLDESGFEAVTVNKAVAAVLAVVRATTRVTPWRVTLARLEDGVLSSTVYRNSCPLGFAVIDGIQLGLVAPGPAKDEDSSRVPEDRLPALPVVHLERLAAAHVLTTMATAYGNVGFEALDGANSWKSIGLQYVARSDLDESNVHAELALLNALDAEPHRFAHYVLLVRQYRMGKVSSGELITRISDSIPSSLHCSGQPQLQPMRQRMLYLSLAALINAWHESAAYSETRVAMMERIVICSTDLYAAVRNDLGSRTMNGARDEILPGAACLLAWVHNHCAANSTCAAVTCEGVWSQWLNAEIGPLASYQLGCLYATARPDRCLPELMIRAQLPGGHIASATLPQRAVACLEMARKSVHLQDWMLIDPQLAQFRKSPEFRTAFGVEPSTDVLSLSVLRPFRQVLEHEGLTDTRSLTKALRCKRRWLRRRLRLHRESFVRVEDLVSILASAEQHGGLKDFAIELAQALTDLHALDVSDGDRSDAGIEQLCESIMTDFMRRLTVAPKRSALKCWLLDLPEPEL